MLVLVILLLLVQVLQVAVMFRVRRTLVHAALARTPEEFRHFEADGVA